MADPLVGQGTQRQGSLRSVASNTSIGSGVSLTRRARTRARSKTLTGGGSSVRSDKLPKSPTSELPYLDKVNVEQPLESTSFNETTSTGLPTQPTQSPLETETILVQPGNDSPSPVVDNYSGDLRSYSISGSRASRQTSGLQIYPTVSRPLPPPSAFSRDPSLTRINMAGANVRDSMSTQQSGVSSSIYPPSSSTTSESPSSPRSMAEQDDNYGISSYDPDLGEVQEYDGDDVAYRLRLLVKNNYFLPPAHSKPSPSDFAPSGLTAPKKPTRSPTPTFMDLFRGKAKSKPTTPTGTQGFDPNMPALRTAADSITGSFAPRPQPRSSSQIPRHSPLPGDRSGRVVVVREKMHDIAVAAKQAEQDMKARGIRLDSVSQLGPSDAHHDVIDPTDAVDLPPPSSNYPFAVQASALHGLGVRDSVGAALLAERLPPPPGSPGMSDAEDDWRKALLHQAVHHSLDSTSPDVSSFSMLDSSTPVHSSKLNHVGTAGRGKNTKRLLEQRILPNPVFSDVSPPQLSRKRSNRSQTSLSRSKELSTNHLSPLDTSRPSSYLPLRADTPVGPLTPLTPPPRKYLVNPLYSLSQTDLPRPEPPRQSLSVAHPLPPSLRKTMSSPMLSDSYESDPRHAMLTPPPLPRSSLSAQSSFHDLSGTGSFETSRSHPASPVPVSSASRFSEDDHPNDDEGAPRASIALSAVNDGRPSFSEYSQPSPTASVFRDQLYQGSHRSITPSHLQHHRSSLEQESSRDSPVPRYSAMSPPPRISSSLAHFALSPPPRSSSFHYKAMTPTISSTPPISEPEHSSNQPLTDDTTLLIIAPEPTTPPFPIAERRGIPSRNRLSVDIPPTDIPVAIHSAPGPSSPTSFFDTIQTQPNAMDDLDSSSGESDEDEGDSQTPPHFMDPRARAISHVSPAQIQRPMIMRLGNHSSPYVGRATENHRPSRVFADDDSRKPVGNIPVRAPFFTERSGKSDQDHGPPVSTYDFYKYTQQHRPATSGEPSTSTPVIGKRRSATIGPVAEWRNQQKAQESLRKLDGMLLQHMETEKDTIKRIATSVRSNIASQKPGRLYS